MPSHGTPNHLPQSRTRSFGGCDTCRARHLKCDERRPGCGNCARSRLTCKGYATNCQFHPDSLASGAGAGHFRRPVMSERERARMSELLCLSVTSKDVIDMINTLEDQCERLPMNTVFQAANGPFGVFKIMKQGEAQPVEHGASRIVEQDSPVLTMESLHQSGTGSMVVPAQEEPLSDTTLLCSGEPIEIDPLLDFFHADDQLLNSTRLEEFLSVESLAFGAGLPPPLMPSQQEDHELAQSLGFPLAQSSPTSILYSQPQLHNNFATPDNSVRLLKHYMTTVVDSLTLFRHTKTPWHVLFLPHAKTCLAALSLGEQVDHATLCAFYGILAISAYSLSGITQSQKFREQAETAKDQACEHARLMLSTAYSDPKTAKYKHVLMALLIMVQINTFVGNKNDTEYYLLEAEKFVRLRGLKRSKSRKVRILHHCLVYTRIFYESLGVSCLTTQHRHHVRQAVECSGKPPEGQDSLSFRLRDWKDLHQEMLVPKSREAGENDLHLECPGLYAATLYPEIYGVPEPLVFLLSQVIRLANEIDASEKDFQRNSVPLREIMRRAKSIEVCIDRLQQLIPSSDSSSPHVESQLLDEVLFGMQAALKIYFYRRIYDVPASHVQKLCQDVRDWLLCRDITIYNLGIGYVGFIWPAFLAACEAEDADVQESFAGWFRASASKSGLACFNDVLSAIEKVWQRKTTPSGCNVTWLDMMSEGRRGLS